MSQIDTVSGGQVSVVATKYWQALDDGRVQCEMCPRPCKIRVGQRGLCFVRACVDGRIALTTYGRASGFCVDPIEKKPLFHFLPGTPVLSFGTAGCNLACKFCQNWDISKSREDDTLAESASPTEIAARAHELGCASVAFTYNDPVVFHEFAIDTAAACRRVGIRAVAVTAGYVMPEPRVEFYRHMDAVNVDLKAFTEEFYRRVCAGHLEPVRETLEYIHDETNVWLEVTTLLIPGLNDSPGEIGRLTSWIVERLGPDVPMHFSAYHPDFKMMDVGPTPPGTLTMAREIALGTGRRHVYTGNVHDVAGQTTYCHQCGAVLIERDWYRLGLWGIDETGKCKSCSTPFVGVIDPDSPGTWGPRRLPIRFARTDGSGLGTESEGPVPDDPIREAGSIP